MKFKTKIENLEIRGKEEKKGKNGDMYLVVKFDDEAGERLEFIDRDADRFRFYKRGEFCDIMLYVNSTRDFTNFTIIDMTILKDDGGSDDE